MKNIVISLLLGAIIGGTAMWYLQSGRSSPRVQRVEERVTAVTGRALESAQTTAIHVAEVLAAKMESFDLRTDDIRRDLAATGRVVRRRARDLGTAAADATADARVTAAIKARLAADPTSPC